MRKKAFTYVHIVILFAVLGGLSAVFFWPVYSSCGPGNFPRTTCQSNLKQIGLGIKQYVQDYDEKFPLASAGKQGWGEVIQPYIKSPSLLQCPNEKTPHSSHSFYPLTTDYFYNSRLSGVKEEKLDYLSNVLMAGDGLPNQVPNSNLSALPTLWFTDSTSPAWRHLEGANYLYADSHVKWLRPTSVQSSSPTPNNSTFAIK
jgi:prepilin-type processing-associated H-X9-DG protein